MMTKEEFREMYPMITKEEFQEMYPEVKNPTNNQVCAAIVQKACIDAMKKMQSDFDTFQDELIKDTNQAMTETMLKVWDKDAKKRVKQK
jgi:hypothetical protein